MLPAAFPTKICKSRSFMTETGALQKDMQRNDMEKVKRYEHHCPGGSLHL